MRKSLLKQFGTEHDRPVGMIKVISHVNWDKDDVLVNGIGRNEEKKT